ncbi:MerR family transcriptional regulator [Erysipelothrix sp. HDW6C]|uniref:MerR family transcriptional regulator n=1 Tax=Erysipelothrix sp. HDW6C TaxID=2714930 RepID=UPI001409B381|nr:MerR family transcriptional regulator [Erysipelothrix sp. HDW6C]QIK69665.1 MerR family transcriptional regulator [Erysipelothrix sp. HDW6C]
MNSLYTVSQVAKETGVTIKTLHHYQTIKLLLPSKIGENGYRYYSEADIKLLQEILLYRTMGFSLHDINGLLSTEGYSTRIQRLEHQLTILNASIEKTQGMIKTINASLLAERKEQNMKHQEMFEHVDKQDDSIYRTMQNITILLSKPFTLVFFVLGIAMTIAYARALIIDTPIFGAGTEGNIVSVIFLILGISCSIVSGYNLFFVKTKDMLNTLNQKYRVK